MYVYRTYISYFTGNKELPRSKRFIKLAVTLNFH